ncbi:MAG: hypothetical protein GYB32_09520 [Algicola sp.]|nr:hypothetical protein [Algicola sp.]
MKTPITKYILFSVLLLVLSTACRKEEMESIQTAPEDTLEANSNIAQLMQRTTMNDGSNDNIIDNSNCFNISLPVTVIANDIEVTVNTEEDYLVIESIFDAFDDDYDSLEILFPIIIVLNDFSEITIANYSELNNYSNNCNGENEFDADIECLDFVYPMTAVAFNTNSEILYTETFTTDYELYLFLEQIESDDLISLNFPIDVFIADGSIFSISDFFELETIIEQNIDVCDEDDDYDYNDDDCDDCTPLLLQDILTNCSDWYVDKLERNDVDYDDAYVGYLFNFFENGTLSVYWESTTVYGTWNATGLANNITIVVEIPSLPLCNNNWVLQEIDDSSSETKVDLRVGESDRLRYKNDTCN